VTVIRLGPSAQINLPRDIQEAAHLQEGDELDAEVTATGTILLKPVGRAGREPTPAEEAEILAAVDEARAFYAAKSRP
jgi:antitoxin component of MazEF toxin-antitoxin module